MTTTLPGLTREHCQTRQQHLATALAVNHFDAALIAHPGTLHALAGHWTRGVFEALLLVRADGSTLLAVPGEPDPCSAREVIHFEGSRLATMVDDQFAAAVHALVPHLQNLKRLGTDSLPAGLLPTVENITAILRPLRRPKLPDEIALIQRGIDACEAAYARTREILRPGLTEWELYRAVHAAALEAVGESIGELGNDFQSGGGGGLPRHRPMQAGELIPLDLSVVVRGYSSDLCRTFAVDHHPTDLQQEAHRRIVAALDHVEKTVRPGTSCKKLYHEVFDLLQGDGEHRGWKFPHHLGHGIGLSAHEAPRLNPHWNDTFHEGDVFTAEPGLYHEELKSGIRLEQNYLVTATGIQRLSQHPLDL